ncbi:carboxylate--amine ligase [Halorussus litoreus]|uniref:carboxylate--amine ligase n=1 Tax=Halorussus litoreus TaxID=1710536 RepID=UPI000E259205|nr:ATP-grasp domain-containing protein [Halorussus litoreus]
MSTATEDTPSVVIPTGVAPYSYPCLRSLSRRGIHTVAASEHDHVPAFASRFCDETVSLPDPEENLLAYKDALLRLAERRDVGTVIPIREYDAYVLSRYREEFADRLAVEVPEIDTLARVHDRVKLAEAAEAAGVPVPETRTLDEIADWDGEYIVKSRYNLLADEYVDTHSPSQAEEVNDVTHNRPGEIPDRDQLVAEMRHVPIVQEFVPYDEEYMFAALYDRGEAVATFQHHQIRGNSYTGGGGVYRESMYDPELERVATDLLDELDWHGLACIEYMEHADTGEYVLTEINPRMWQSLPSTVWAGADFPHYYWLQSQGRTDEIDPDFDLGVGSHLLYGELGYLASVLSDESPFVERPSLAWTALEICESVCRQPRFDFLRLDDPRPFVHGVLRTLPIGR